MNFFHIKRLLSLIASAALFLSVELYAQDAPAAQSAQAPSELASAAEQAQGTENVEGESDSTPKPRKAENIDLKDVIVELEKPEPEAESAAEKPEPGAKPESTLPDKAGPARAKPEENTTTATESDVATKSLLPDASIGETTPAAGLVGEEKSVQPDAEVTAAAEPEVVTEPVVPSKVILGVEVPPSTSTRLVWTPEDVVSGLAERTPVLVVNGKTPGKTLCLTGAVHGDELNGIEMIRRIMYQLKPEELTGTVIGVPVVNIMGFRRNSRYLPDRRDLNRYFPGNTHGSSASRIAHSFFTNIIRHCDALVDIHTGSFHRTNLTQLRADLSNEQVAELAQSFGVIAVLNSRGNSGSLRAAAVRAGIPSVTVEAGEPMRMQSDVVAEGTKAIEMLLAKMGMYGRTSKWTRQAPVYYKSVWVRSDQSGILFSRAPLGKRVVKGEVLGTVTDPITNKRSDVVSPYQGRILGMALDQVVLPGFAAYHIGIQTPEAILIEEGLLGADDDGDDAPVQNGMDSMTEPGTLTKPQDNMDDEEE